METTNPLVKVLQDAVDLLVGEIRKLLSGAKTGTGTDQALVNQSDLDSLAAATSKVTTQGYSLEAAAAAASAPPATPPPASPKA